MISIEVNNIPTHNYCFLWRLNNWSIFRRFQVKAKQNSGVMCRFELYATVCCNYAFLNGKITMVASRPLQEIKYKQITIIINKFVTVLFFWIIIYWLSKNICNSVWKKSEQWTLLLCKIDAIYRVKIRFPRTEVLFLQYSSKINDLKHSFWCHILDSFL